MSTRILSALSFACATLALIPATASARGTAQVCHPGGRHSSYTNGIFAMISANEKAVRLVEVSEATGTKTVIADLSCAYTAPDGSGAVDIVCSGEGIQGIRYAARIFIGNVTGLQTGMVEGTQSGQKRISQSVDCPFDNSNVARELRQYLAEPLAAFEK